MAQRMNYLKNNMDWLRKSMIREPRRYRDMFGGILSDIPTIVPKISCRPFITGFNKFVIDPDNPFAEGFVP